MEYQYLVKKFSKHLNQNKENGCYWVVSILDQEVPMLSKVSKWLINSSLITLPLPTYNFQNAKIFHIQNLNRFIMSIKVLYIS